MKKFLLFIVLLAVASISNAQVPAPPPELDFWTRGIIVAAFMFTAVGMGLLLILLKKWLLKGCTHKWI